MNIRYVNYQTTPVHENCFKEWFYIRRYWRGKLIHIGIRHHALVIDIRKNWISDMME